MFFSLGFCSTLWGSGAWDSCAFFVAAFVFCCGSFVWWSFLPSFTSVVHSFRGFWGGAFPSLPHFLLVTWSCGFIQGCLFESFVANHIVGVALVSLPTCYFVQVCVLVHLCHGLLYLILSLPFFDGMLDANVYLKSLSLPLLLWGFFGVLCCCLLWCCFSFNW